MLLRLVCHRQAIKNVTKTSDKDNGKSTMLVGCAYKDEIKYS